MEGGTRYEVLYKGFVEGPRSGGSGPGLRATTYRTVLSVRPQEPVMSPGAKRPGPARAGLDFLGASRPITHTWLRQ